MSRNPIIAVDVDEVCADLLSAWLGRYNAKYNDTLKLEDIRGWAMVPQVKPECGEKIYELLTDDIYQDVQVMDGALEGIHKLRQVGRVIFVTSGNGTAKLAWLKRHGFLPNKHEGDIDFFQARDKTLIKADYLLDDHIKNVESFPGRGILINHWHNTLEDTKCPRAWDLFEAWQIISKLEDWYRFAP